MADNIRLTVIQSRLHFFQIDFVLKLSDEVGFGLNKFQGWRFVSDFSAQDLELAQYPSVLTLLLRLRIVEQLVNEVCCVLDIFLPFFLQLFHGLSEIEQLIHGSLSVLNRLRKSVVVGCFAMSSACRLQHRLDFLFELRDLALELIEVYLFVCVFPESFKQREICLLAQSLDKRNFDLLDFSFCLLRKAVKFLFTG